MLPAPKRRSATSKDSPEYKTPSKATTPARPVTPARQASVKSAPASPSRSDSRPRGELARADSVRQGSKSPGRQVTENKSNNITSTPASNGSASPVVKSTIVDATAGSKCIELKYQQIYLKWTEELAKFQEVYNEKVNLIGTPGEDIHEFMRNDHEIVAMLDEISMEFDDENSSYYNLVSQRLSVEPQDS